LFKRGGKQFRRALKTKDRKLADRRLNNLRAKIGCLKISTDAKLNFEQAAKMWLETNRHAASSGTVKRREMYIKGLTPYFKNLPVRNITGQNCDRWVKERGDEPLAMKRYGHLRQEHSFAMIKRVSFDQPPNNSVPLQKPSEVEDGKSPFPADDRRAIAKAKAKYNYPWRVLLTAGKTMGCPIRFSFSSTGLCKTFLLFLCQRSGVCSSFVRLKFALWNFAFYVRRAVEN
jgi:hypothetical protein